MPDVLYLAVTPDRMELPIAVGDSITDLARTMRTSVCAVSHNYKRSLERGFCEQRHNRESYRVRRVELEVDNHG